MENPPLLLLTWLGRLVGVLTLVPVLGLATLGVLYSSPESVGAAAGAEPAFYCGTSEMPSSWAAVWDLPGRLVFEANCQQCHALQEVVVGPALAGATARVPPKLWTAVLYADPQHQLRRSRYYRRLRAQYGNQSFHTDFKFDYAAPARRDLVAYLDSASVIVQPLGLD